MGVFSENAIIGASAAGGGYDIDNSCRFNDADTPYLAKTMTSAGDRKKWTASFWYKRSLGATSDTPLSAIDGTLAFSNIQFTSDMVQMEHYPGSTTAKLRTTRLFRDPSAWYHIVMNSDTTLATADDRMKIYVNGVQETGFALRTNPAQNMDWYFNDGSSALEVSRLTTHGQYLDGYLAEFHYIDGQALTPSSFAETDEDTNEWKAIRYAGTYGTNGFFLEFKSSGALGTDTSGNGNNMSVNNLVATDQMIDTPQNSTGGSFATLNPLYYSSTAYDIQEGNLKFVNSSASWWKVLSTFGMTSGKWYAEVRFADNGAGPLATFGAVSNYTPWAIPNMHNQYVGQKTYEQGYHKNGYTETGGSNPGSGTYASYAAGDKMGCAIDVDNLKIYWAKNGTWQNSGDPTSGSTGTGARDLSNNTQTDGLWFFGFTGHQMNPTVNFGQDSSFAGTETAQGNTDGNSNGDFYYTPPSGYLALCSNNLEDPSIALPGEHFNTVLYTGNGGSSTDAITGVGFQPDLNWIKKTSASADHYLTTSVSGLSKGLLPNTTAATDNIQRISSFDSDGFTLPATLYSYVNTNGATYVSWNWKASGSTTSNTTGTITSTVSANTTAGFSICKYTGNGTGNATFGHGLSTSPDLVVIKSMTTAHGWMVWTPTLGSSGGDCTYLFSWDGSGGVGNWCEDTIRLNGTTKVQIGSSSGGTTYSWVNKTGTDYIAYCWNIIEGYSMRGLYKGTGNADGPFVYTGFRPAYIWLKGDGSSQHWHTFDTKRYPYNQTTNTTTTGIVIDSSANTGGGSGEGMGPIDILSNGFKPRANNGNGNDANTTFTYLAFAEYPFKYSRAR